MAAHVDMRVGVGGRGEGEEEGEEMAWGIMTEKEVELTRVSLGMEEWVALGNFGRCCFSSCAWLCRTKGVSGKGASSNDLK